MRHSHAQLPPIQTGYALEGARSWWSVVVPLPRTNIVTNPSFETEVGSTTSARGSASIARVATEQYHGVYSLEITPTAAVSDGARSFLHNPTAGVTYAYSCKVKGRAGVPYRFFVGDNAGTKQSGVHFRGTGRWQWVSFLWKATAISTYLYLLKDSHASTGIFYWDGLQIESCADGVLAATTYIDGDQAGLVPNQYPPAFYWTGTPHASASVRSGQTRAGGYVMPLSRYAFLLTAIIGLGMIAPTDIATPYAQLDGAQYERSIFAPRQFSLAGRIQGRAMSDLDRKRAALAAVLGRDATGQQQPLTLLYQQWDRDRAASDVGRILATYQGGLDGNADNLYAEAVAPTFRMYVPFILGDGEQGAALDVQESVSDADYILSRTASGAWQALGTGITGTIVNAILVARDGTVYVGGDFTDAGGSGADYIAKWNPTTSSWAAVGSATALNAQVRAIVEGPDGAIYVGGDFTNAGGVAAADYIAKWNGSAWSALGTGANAAGVYSLAFDSAGNLYAGGSFTLMGGVANTVRIAKWSGSAWSALGTGAAANIVKALAWSRDGYLYAGGNFFTGMGGVANTAGIARWNGTAWGSITAETIDVNALAIGPDNRVYIGHASIIVGISQYIVVYNGVSLAPLGDDAALSGAVNDLAFLSDGRLLVASDGVTFDGNTVDDGLGIWNGGSWEPVMINLPTAQAQVIAVAVAPDGAYYIGSNWSGTATAPGRTTITNDGMAKAYPTLTIKGPTSGTATIAGIENLTTGRSVRILSTAAFLISAGETWTLSFEPNNLRFTSDVQGNIASRIRPGSNEADFFLAPGDNEIALYSSSSTVTATLSWRPRYEHLSELTL